MSILVHAVTVLVRPALHEQRTYVWLFLTLGVSDKAHRENTRSWELVLGTAAD